MNDRDQIARFASYLLAGGLLLLVIRNGLVGALFAGLLVYSLVHMSAPALERKISSARARLVAVAIIGSLVVTLLSLSIWGTILFFRSDAGSLHVLLQKMADIIDASRIHFPEWMRSHLPDDAEALRVMLGNWLRDHALEARTLGEQAGRMAAHLLIGMIIGALVALHDAVPHANLLPLTKALRERAVHLGEAFRRIVFAQVRIAAINAVLTGIYLAVILPLAGIKLPLIKSMIAITFAAGMLPVVGNLISNTVLVIVALSHSLHIAVISLLYLVIIHKLEYFLNARIIGTQIEAKAWELLIAMLIMEATFGLVGVVAAPVLYAYLKRELAARRWI
ncbi:MAG: family transporter [Paucimonas sp.]|jgi:predicted PurR-regulated permease PerM|nr:family transporter [Paucimonas sp.]